MITWVTAIGEKPMAAVNTLWATLHEDKPGQVAKLIVFCSDDMKDKLLTFTSWAEILFSEYQEKQPKLQTISFARNDFNGFRKLFRQTLSKTDGKIMTDMTSGRKAISALMLLIGDLFPGKVEKVYYTYLADPDYANFPYPLIPVNTSHVFNLREK